MSECNTEQTCPLRLSCQRRSLSVSSALGTWLNAHCGRVPRDRPCDYDEILQGRKAIHVGTNVVYNIVMEAQLFETDQEQW